MKKSLSFVAILSLAACATPQGQNQYRFDEVGRSTMVEFATVITSREVGITGRNSGAGLLLGGAAGAAGASYVGNGDGQAWAMAGGALVGAVAGAAAEQSLANKIGIEYVVTTEKGKTKTIVQNKEEGDVILRPGDRVMVQTSGSYQRVLPAGNLPTTIKRPKNIQVTD